MSVGVKSTDLTGTGLRSPNRKLRGQPDRRAGVWKSRALDGASTIRFGRRIRGEPEGAKNPQQIFPDLISNLGVLYDATTNQQFARPNLIDQSAIQYRPNINQKVTAELISNLAVQYNPQVPLAQTVTAGLISQVGVQYTPTINSKTVFPNLIDNTAVLLTPLIPHVVTAQLISQLGVLYDFGIGIAPDLIDQSGVLYDVEVQHSAVDVQPNLIDQSGVLYDMAVNLAQPNTVTAGLINQEGVLFLASVRQKTKPLIVKVGRYQPTIEKVGLFLPTIVKRGIFES